MQHNPIIRHVKERLEQRGKPIGVIIGAAMRKLLHLAYGVLKNNTPFDPQYGSKRKKQQLAQAHETT